MVLQAAGGWWLAAVGSGGVGGGVVEKAMALAHTRHTSVHPCRKITTLGPTEQRVEDRQRKQQSRVQQTPNQRHQEHEES